ncbi:hypothetical protein [Microlunatus soli]|uniref:Uncharacterized protein n=1 Tax=Microlunatus soli TaxID=630515 RepID=A0A1H1T0X3_9ACTN|nr:hypothetical protein [Microlunatus soli]SDS53788.1 hypothetical protein SAMN04489812_2209 [Microlunatus soli]
MKIAKLGPLQVGSSQPAQWQRDRDAVLSYLKGGCVIRAARSLAPDELDPERKPAVPLTLLTDGAWVWSGAVIYYAERHDVPVDAGLLSHVRDQGFVPAEPSADAVTAALAAVDGMAS